MIMGTFPGISRKEIYNLDDEEYKTLYEQAIFYLKKTGILKDKNKDT